jgi:hypothetical protein
VDIEFTVNYTGESSYAINLVQCRPLQTKGKGKRVKIPRDVPREKVLFRSAGNFMGGSTNLSIERVIMVDPDSYHALKLSEKYDIARLIGKINRQMGSREALSALLVGPGRWGTTTPSLGVPVRFSEINNISVIVELAHIGGQLMPELSYGTHFFQDLVETDIFYVAVFPDAATSFFSKGPLEKYPNRLAELFPDMEKYAHVVDVRDVGDAPCSLYADIVAQEALCFRP